MQNTYSPSQMQHKKLAADEVESEQVKAWDLPYMEKQKTEDQRTNALNRKSDWKYEPPEPEEEILPPTAEEIEAIRQSAREEGFAEGKEAGFAEGKKEGLAAGLEEGKQQGYQEGHAEGLETGKAEIEAQISQWQQLTEKLHQPLAQADAQVQEELVVLAVALAKSVLHTELKTNQDVIFQALSEGLKVLPILEKVYQIHCHPEDIALIKNHFSEAEIEDHNWKLIESPDMARGGCDIVTQSNAVDMTIERRVRNVVDTFLLEQGLQQHAEDSGSIGKDTDHD